MAREEENPRWNVPATPELDERVRERIQRGGFTGLAEHVRSAVRADLERDAEKRLEQQLLEGLDSGEGVEVTPEYWEEKRRSLNERLAAGRSKKER